MELVLVRLEVAELGEGLAGAGVEVGVCRAAVEAALETWWSLLSQGASTLVLDMVGGRVATG